MLESWSWDTCHIYYATLPTIIEGSKHAISSDQCRTYINHGFYNDKLSGHLQNIDSDLLLELKVQFKKESNANTHLQLLHKKKESEVGSQKFSE